MVTARRQEQPQDPPVGRSSLAIPGIRVIAANLLFRALQPRPRKTLNCHILPWPVTPHFSVPL